MKKTLILFRHATAEEQDIRMMDFDRQLIGRGLSEAAVMGRWLASKNIIPDRFVTSEAPRAYQTAEVVANQLRIGSEKIIALRNLYDGGPKAYLSCINSTPETSEMVILFGHNPDITYFSGYLSGASISSMKKGSLVILEFKDQKWEEISARTGEFIQYITPKDVKEAS